MLPLLFPIVIFVFLILGSLVFVVCALIRPTRRYALSAALWCATWGPCSVGWMLLAGLGLIAEAFIGKDGDSQWLHTPRLIAAFGWSYLSFGIAVTAVIATSAAWLHQVLARRMTFALFRLYATAVSAGVGSVFGWSLGWWMMAKGVPRYGLPLWGLGMTSLILAFGIGAYRGARALRGEPPSSFTWITPEEFIGAGE
jgi:hypothetical protein